MGDPPAERSRRVIELHGLHASPEYTAWANMKRRCLDPNHPSYRLYGGRGITVCDEWRRSFTAFLRHVGPKPSPELTLDRIDNEGNYEPGNVRWATWQEQNNNRRCRGCAA